MPELSTAASSGFPMRRESEDMSPESWNGLVGGLLEFLGEEAAEPEHANDDVTATVLDVPRTLYVKRPLKNAVALIAWARKAGFPSTLPPEEIQGGLGLQHALPQHRGDRLSRYRPARRAADHGLPDAGRLVHARSTPGA